jgi:predicted nucleic acid-binding protein
MSLTSLRYSGQADVAPIPRSGFDTNVLVYLASGDPAQADRAEAILSDGGVISVQVLNELTNVARRKMRMTWAEIHAFLSLLRRLLTVQPITMETHDAGLSLAERYNRSTYDAMIPASAIHAGCHTLWSEDMQHGMAPGHGLLVVNPFRATG